MTTGAKESGMTPNRSLNWSAPTASHQARAALCAVRCLVSYCHRPAVMHHIINPLKAVLLPGHEYGRDVCNGTDSNCSLRQAKSC